jgi:dihydrofolate reductase
MRKLKLQVQISVDGFIELPNGEMDWLVWNWDDKLKAYINELTNSVDTILLGRKMTEGFVSHWSSCRPVGNSRPAIPLDPHRERSPETALVGADSARLALARFRSLEARIR